MRRLLTYLLLGLFAMTTLSVAQETAPPDAADVPAEATDAEEEAVAEADEDSDDDDDEEDAEPDIDLDDPAFADLDEQSYEEPEDDFVPTEEIPADQAIPFPTDI